MIMQQATSLSVWCRLVYDVKIQHKFNRIHAQLAALYHILAEGALQNGKTENFFDF